MVVARRKDDDGADPGLQSACGFDVSERKSWAELLLSARRKFLRNMPILEKLQGLDRLFRKYLSPEMLCSRSSKAKHA